MREAIIPIYLELLNVGQVQVTTYLDKNAVISIVNVYIFMQYNIYLLSFNSKTFHKWHDHGEICAKCVPFVEHGCFNEL